MRFRVRTNSAGSMAITFRSIVSAVSHSSNVDLPLRDDWPGVVAAIHHVDCRPGRSVARYMHGLVHASAVNPLPPCLGSKDGWMLRIRPR